MTIKITRTKQKNPTAMMQTGKMTHNEMMAAVELILFHCDVKPDKISKVCEILMD